MPKYSGLVPGRDGGLLALPLDQAPEHAAALGRLMGHWAWLERRLTVVFSKVLDIDHEKAELVWQEFVSVRQKLSLLQRLNAQSKAAQDQKDNLASLLAEAQRLNTERNKFVHALWTTEWSGCEVVTRVRNTAPASIAKTRHADEDFLAEDIQKVVDQIAALSVKLFHWKKDDVPPTLSEGTDQAQDSKVHIRDWKPIVQPPK